MFLLSSYFLLRLVVYGLVYRKNISYGLESQSPVPFSLVALRACVLSYECGKERKCVSEMAEHFSCRFRVF